MFSKIRNPFFRLYSSFFVILLFAVLIFVFLIIEQNSTIDFHEYIMMFILLIIAGLGDIFIIYRQIERRRKKQENDLNK